MPELGRLSLPRGVREQVLLAVHVHPAQGASPPNQMPRVRGWKRGGGVLKESIPEGWHRIAKSRSELFLSSRRRSLVLQRRGGSLPVLDV